MGAGSSPLLQAVREVIRVRHYSICIEQIYLNWIVRYIQFHGPVHPTQLSAEGLHAYFTHRAIDRNVAPNMQGRTLLAHYAG